MSLVEILTGIASGGGAYAWLAMAALAVLGVLGIYAKGRIDRGRKQKLDQAQVDLAAHERMNDAELGEDLSDGQRRERLQSIADRLDRK